VSIQVALKIIKHCKECMPALVTGQLLGLDIGSILEVTNCFPFPVWSSTKYQSPICTCIITSLVASPELAKNHLVRALLFLCHQLLCQSSVLRSISGQFCQSLLSSADESGFHEMASGKQVFLAQVISGLSGEQGLCFYFSLTMVPMSMFV
jgi:hypothetical protein